MNEDTQATGTAAPVTDTAAPQPSEASVQANTDAPEATQTDAEVKGTDATEIKAEDTAEEKLLAGKYKTPEDLEKGYKELESKFGQTTSEKAELTRILNDAFVAPDSTEQDDSYTDESDDPLKRDVSIMKFMIGHQDADGNAMNKVLKEDPLIGQIAGYDAKLEYAYLRSQSMGQKKAIAEAEKKSAESTQVKILEKQSAQVETAQSADKTDENSELYEKATGNYSREQRDAARKAWIRKNLVSL